MSNELEPIDIEPIIEDARASGEFDSEAEALVSFGISAGLRKASEIQSLCVLLFGGGDCSITLLEQAANYTRKFGCHGKGCGDSDPEFSAGLCPFCQLQESRHFAKLRKESRR